MAVPSDARPADVSRPGTWRFILWARAVTSRTTEHRISIPAALAIVTVGAAVGVLAAATIAAATHKGTHDYWHHGLGDCCDGDGQLHPFLDEVAGTYRNSYVAWGTCCGYPYFHSEPEQFDDDSHNHIVLSTHTNLERYHFASVRSPVTALDHQHHVCGGGDCVSASSSEHE